MTRFFLMLWVMLSGTAYADELYHVTRAQVEEAIGQAISAQQNGAKIKASMLGGVTLVTNDRPITVEIGKLSVDEKARQWSAELKCRDDKRELTTLPVTGRFQQQLGMPVLKDSVKAGDVITEDMIGYVDVPESRLRKDEIEEAEKLVGKAAKRNLPASRPIRESDLKTETMVKKGETVRMIYHADKLDIRTLGEALSEGGVGDNIRVRNQESKLIVQAVVKAKGEVEVVPLTGN